MATVQRFPGAKSREAQCPEHLPIPPDDTVREQSYLVARGVRPMALVETFRADPLTMLRVATRLEALADGEAIPFVVDNGDGLADCGYATAAWVVDLFRWAVTSGIPEVQKKRLIGLLLGYSPAAIAAFEERGGKRLFTEPTASLEPASR